MIKLFSKSMQILFYCFQIHIFSAVALTKINTLNKCYKDLKGYIIVYTAATSRLWLRDKFYSGAWPLLENSSSGFQIRLLSTWILPNNKGIINLFVPLER